MSSRLRRGIRYPHKQIRPPQCASDARHIVLRRDRLEIAGSGATAWNREGPGGAKRGPSKSYGEPDAISICREATNENP